MISVRMNFLMGPASMWYGRAHEDCMEIAWRTDLVSIGEECVQLGAEDLPAGSASVSRWLLLASDTSRESGMIAASSSP